MWRWKVSLAVLGVIVTLGGILVPLAYPVQNYPASRTIARWLLLAGLLFLLVRLAVWLRDRRQPKPQTHVVGAAVFLGLTANVTADAIVVPRTPWRTGGATWGGDVLDILTGLLVFLKRDGGIPTDVGYICDARVGGKDAQCDPVRIPPDMSKGLTVIYPKDFNQGDVVPLPLRPGTHWFAWRENKGTTASFLIALKAEVKANGTVTCQEWFKDPMAGES